MAFNSSTCVRNWPSEAYGPPSMTVACIARVLTNGPQVQSKARIRRALPNILSDPFALRGRHGLWVPVTGFEKGCVATLSGISKKGCVICVLVEGLDTYIGPTVTSSNSGGPPGFGNCKWARGKRSRTGLQPYALSLLTTELLT